MSDDRKSIGARVAEARRSAGLTQRELASTLGVTVRTVQNYEAGVAVPYRHVRTIELLAHKPPGWLLEGGDETELQWLVAALHRTMERQ